MNCETILHQLGAYVDQQLSPAEAAAFEAHLRGCCGCATAAREQLQLKLATRAAGMRYEPSAEFQRRMQQCLHGATARPRRAWLSWPMAIPVAAAVLLAALLFAGNHQRRTMLAELTDLHVSTLASANPLDVASEDRHTVKPWFAGRIPFTFNLPELKESGFALDGGRVVYLQHNSGAQLLYTLRKHRLSVFIFQSGQEWPGGINGTARELSFHMESWSQEGLRYVVVGDVADSDVHALAELFRQAARP
jgi:anti-sigma factor RsiW